MTRNCARSSADRALASGARGQRFESSRAYHAITPVFSVRCRHSSLACYRFNDGRVVCCTYASRRGGVEKNSIRPAPQLEARAAVFPATRPCSGCRLPPSSGSGRTGALAVRQGAQEGYAWSFAGTARLMPFSARSVRFGTSLAGKVTTERR